MTEAGEAPAPPLPEEAPPDDGWDALWDPNTQAYYFYNRFTGVSTWNNPRVPEATTQETTTATTSDSHNLTSTADSSASDANSSSPTKRPHGGYNPKIHGDYDPNADYARAYDDEEETAENTSAAALAADPASYIASAHFNRFTGRYQDPSIDPERHNDENKSRHQLNAFYDADAQANSHDGRSLKAERQGKKLSKKEVQAFNEKRRKRKEEKRRAFYRD